MMNQPTDTQTERNNKTEARRLRAMAVDSASRILAGMPLTTSHRVSEVTEIALSMADRLYEYISTGKR